MGRRLKICPNIGSGRLYLSRNSESKRIGFSENISEGTLTIDTGDDVSTSVFYRADTTVITADNALLTADYRI